MTSRGSASRSRTCARGSIKIDYTSASSYESSGVITGFNTDIRHNDKVYHIQTEDKGLSNPYIESLVYVGGEILASKKTSYAEQAKSGIDEKWIGSLMEQQHRTMIAAIKRGRPVPPADITKSTPRPTLASPIPGAVEPAPIAIDEE